MALRVIHCSLVNSSIFVVKGSTGGWSLVEARQDILDAEAGPRRSGQPTKQVMISEAVVRESSKENLHK